METLKIYLICFWNFEIGFLEKAEAFLENFGRYF